MITKDSLSSYNSLVIALHSLIEYKAHIVTDRDKSFLAIKYTFVAQST